MAVPGCQYDDDVLVQVSNMAVIFHSRLCSFAIRQDALLLPSRFGRWSDLRSRRHRAAGNSIFGQFIYNLLIQSLCFKNTASNAVAALDLDSCDVMSRSSPPVAPLFLTTQGDRAETHYGSPESVHLIKSESRRRWTIQLPKWSAAGTSQLHLPSSGL